MASAAKTPERYRRADRLGLQVSFGTTGAEEGPDLRGEKGDRMGLWLAGLRQRRTSGKREIPRDVGILGPGSNPLATRLHPEPGPPFGKADP